MLAFVGIIYFLLIAGDLFEGFNSELYAGLFSLVILWPLLAVHTKRWHDRGRSGWWLLLGVIPACMFWILIECAFLRGTLGGNQFGDESEGTLGSKGNVDRFYPVLVGLLICLSMASTFFPRYRIPSGAMMPTLLIGDFLLANRVAYGVPMPFTEQEAIPLSMPARGDVIVFHHPRDESSLYIKRVIGRSGDHVAYSGKELYINGERISQTELGTYTGEGSGERMTGALLRSEKLERVEYSVLISPESPDFALGCEEMEGYEIKVPKEHYFVMGDNRDNSNDSRCWGFVPRKYIVGKALIVGMSWDSQRQGFPIEFSRIGKLVR